MVLGVNSKRQRRPNVRLGEIGDASAAISCRSSWKFRENWEDKKLKPDDKNYDEAYSFADCGFPAHKSEFSKSNLVILPRLDMHNRENRNPNSAKATWEFTCLENNVSKEKLEFGNVNRKSRVMKRKGRSGREYSSIGAWNYKFSSEFGNESRNVYGADVFEVPVSNADTDVYTLEEFKDPLDHETSDEPISDTHVRGDSYEFGMANICRERNGFSSDDGQCFNNKTSEVDSMMNVTVVHNVREWLEELGFAKYAGVFKMHEVDEEVLPLLTFEDLKEMGIDAVGPRRKIFTAIQLLKDRPYAQ